MTRNTNSQPEPSTRIDQLVANAVTQSWDDLMPDSKSGLIHIEYQTGSDCRLDFVFIWASTIRGYWNLVCELWMRPLFSHSAGLRFSNDYHSSYLTSRLKFAMQHEDELKKLPDRHGLIQVFPPQEEKSSSVDASEPQIQHNAA